MKGLDNFEARLMLQQCDINLGADFHALTGDKVTALLSRADFYRYRAPKNANGSRARYFHDFLQRKARK